jgi:hypothetical protein
MMANGHPKRENGWCNALCHRLFTKHARRIGFILVAMLTRKNRQSRTRRRDDLRRTSGQNTVPVDSFKLQVIQAVRKSHLKTHPGDERHRNDRAAWTA